MKKILLSFVLVGSTITGFGQDWEDYKQEVSLSLGATFLFSDVGGASKKSSHAFTDVNFKSTRLSGALSYNYFFKPNMSVVGTLSLNSLSAKDKNANNTYRQNRNFDIKTNVIELSAQYRYYFVKEQFGKTFEEVEINGVTDFFSMLGNRLSAYAGLGLGGIYFNPKGRHSDGKYYALQPLGTEGQGLVGGAKKYSRVSIVIPLSIGAKFPITDRFTVGAELCIRKTFTDYLDDVSTTYYDNSAIVAANGDKAGYLANPSVSNDPDLTVQGRKRGGSKYDDLYTTLMFSATYKIPSGQLLQPQKWFKPREWFKVRLSSL